MQEKKRMSSRRNFLKLSVMASITTLPTTLLSNNEEDKIFLRERSIVTQLNPMRQPKFKELAPNAFSANNFVKYHKNLKQTQKAQNLKIVVGQYNHSAGLIDRNNKALITPMWGYGTKESKVSWPGPTIETFTNTEVSIRWKNRLLKDRKPLPHLLPVDTSLHWAYGIHGYKNYSIEKDGVPLVPHVHGAHVNSSSDGNPEYFFSPNWKIRGPRWVEKKYTYDNSQEAGCLWYHDHTLGITRLNVYAGLAGFYIIRDEKDTGQHDNPLNLPAKEYELGYVIQDRMFKDNGELFFPAYPNEPAYNEFIFGQDAILPRKLFPEGGPSALAEFFGDHIVVNGKIWPKAELEPRHYRMRVLNGCDSRFMAVRFRVAQSSNSITLEDASEPISFWVIGSDQGLAKESTSVTQLLMAPADRWDIVVDFSKVPYGSRVIMENIAGDAPFSGTLVGDTDFDEGDLFENRQTDRIMAFDINQELSDVEDNFHPSMIESYKGNSNSVDKVRKLGLFEGKDEFGRLQPMLGTAESALDMEGNLVQGTLSWHAPITENPKLGTTEIWEIYNNTEDAHPIHVHLVSFEILDRQEFTADIISQPVQQHDGSKGKGFYIENIALVDNTIRLAAGIEKAPKDMVISYPGEVTRIKMTFDKAGRYVWHCHILSHEDHDMMRPMFVG